MTDLWNNATVAQALILLVVVWVLGRATEHITYAIRARRGLPTGDHCVHCSVVDGIGEQLDKLVAIAGDSFTVLEELNGSARQTSDGLAAVRGRVDDLVRVVSAATLTPAAGSRS